jgi:sugar lactone lactonase YvrE
VSALLLDPAGRLYAATPNDLQVFDPTGRLSGVLTLPEKGKRVEILRWEGPKNDVLAAWSGEQKWTRKMNPKGR